MASIERGLGAKRVHAKSTVSMHVSKGLEQGQVCARVRSRGQRQSNTRSAAGSKCRAGCGGRGRCAHLAALDEEYEEIVVVARLKERHAS